MAIARSSRLAEPVTPTSGGVTALTVPAGQTWLLKSLYCVNSGAISSGLIVSIDTPTSASTVACAKACPPGVHTQILDGLIVLNEGDVLKVSSASASLVCWFFGARLTA